MTHEPSTTAIGRSAQARLAHRTYAYDRAGAVAPVPRPIQVWIVVTLVAGAFLTSCASAERAGEATTASTPASTLATTTSTRAPSTSTSTTTPTTTSTSTLAPTTTAAVPESTTPSAPTDGGLAFLIPDVAGVDLEDAPADDVVWHFYEVPGLVQHHQVIRTDDGVEIGRIVVASGYGTVSPIDTYVAQVFSQGIQLPRDDAPMADDRTLVLTNEADVAWAGLGGAAVIAATVPGSDAARWAWTNDGLLWVVGGSLAAKEYAFAVLTTQVGSLDPWDQQGMTGALDVYAPAIPGFVYYDLPRVDAIAAMPEMLLGGCYERYYAGYVLPEDAAVETSPHLYWAIFRIAGSCADRGFATDVANHVSSTPGFEPGSIEGVDVLRDDYNIVALHDDIVIHLSADPTTFDEYQAFVDAFFAAQPFQPA